MFINSKINLLEAALSDGVLFLVYVVVQFYPWFKFYFLLFLGMLMYDNEFKTKENKIKTKDKIEPQHIQV